MSKNAISFVPLFKCGDKVKWVSQVNGGWVEKVGEVIAIVPPFSRPSKVLSDFAQTAYRTTVDPRTAGCRKHQSYVVLVTPKEKTPIMYWPVISQLQRVS